MEVCDKHHCFGGKQCIIHPDGYIVPLFFCDGLPYMDMCKPTSKELEELPHVYFTADSPWDPKSTDDEAFTSPINDIPEKFEPLLFWKGETDQEAKQAGSVLPLIEGSDRIGAISVQNSSLPFLLFLMYPKLFLCPPFQLGYC